MKTNLKPKKKNPQAKAPWTRMRGGIKPRFTKAVQKKIWKKLWPKIKVASKARQKLIGKYNRQAALFKLGRPCFCVGIAVNGKPICGMNGHLCTDVHHVRGRLGSLLTDERHWIGVCATAHNWIHNNVALARKLGLLCQPGEWNKPQREAA